MIKDLITSSIYRYGAVSINFISILLIGSILNAAEFGQYSLAINTVTFLSLILSMSYGRYVIVELSAVDNKKGKAKLIIRDIVKICIISSVASFIITYSYFSIIRNDEVFKSDFFYIFVVFSVPILVWLNCTPQLLSIFGRSKLQQKYYLLGRFICLFLFYFIYVINVIDFNFLVLSYFASNAAICFAEYITLKKILGSDTGNDNIVVNKINKKELLYIHMDTIGFVLISYVLSLIIESKLSIEEYGIFNFAFQIVSAMLICSTIVEWHMAKVAAEHGFIKGVDISWKKISIYILVLSVVIIISYYPISIVLELTINEKLKESISLLSWLITLPILRLIPKALHPLLLSINKAKELAIQSITVVIMGVPLSLFLIDRFGVYGGVISIITQYTLSFVFVLIISISTYRENFNKRVNTYD